MQRRDFLRSLSLTAMAALVRPKTASAAQTALPLRGRRPNIIFLMADDIGYGDLGCYGQQEIKTPNIDRIAAKGIRFTQAYAGACVCTPSRCALMTGFHNGHSAARDNVPHYHTYLQEADRTVAELLQEAGYATCGVGKWSLGDAGAVGRATNQGFDHWFGYLNQDHAHYYYTEYLDDDEGRLELPGNTKTRHTYSHDLMADRALEFIDTHREQPFFLYGAFTLPHFSAPSEDPDGLAVPSTAPYSDRPWEAKAKKYAAMVHRLDKDVGRILDRLDQHGLTENTLVIFTSDNGGHDTIPAHLKTSGPLRGFKRDLSEGGIRTPFLAQWPGVIPQGAVSNELIAFWDMLPTFAELAGAPAPTGIDGISVTPALLGQQLPEPHAYLYWDYGHCRDRYDQAVRMGHWKGIRLGRGAPLELYDLAADIGEKNNLAASHPEIVAQLEALMENAVTPHPRYPIGELYQGGPIWQPTRRSRQKD